jgi:HD-GYP domain-containing protein (c-di-GMP phosphodiesterase class II)
MTTDRPYRKALGIDIVIAELQKHRGTQFDPKLVDLVIGSVTIRRLIGFSAPSQSPIHALRNPDQVRSFPYNRKVN